METLSSRFSSFVFFLNFWGFYHIFSRAVWLIYAWDHSLDIFWIDAPFGQSWCLTRIMQIKHWLLHVYLTFQRAKYFWFHLSCISSLSVHSTPESTVSLSTHRCHWVFKWIYSSTGDSILAQWHRILSKNYWNLVCWDQRSIFWTVKR